MKAGDLRDRALREAGTALRGESAESIALAIERLKAIGVSLAGLPDDAIVDEKRLDLSTRAAATVLGFHPEHVRRLIRTGRLPARREGADYRLALGDVWPTLEARHREPGQRRSGRHS